jgi:hypothetical protein
VYEFVFGFQTMFRRLIFFLNEVCIPICAHRLRKIPVGMWLVDRVHFPFLGLKWMTIIKPIILFSQCETKLPLLVMYLSRASGYWLLTLDMNSFYMWIKLTFNHFSRTYWTGRFIHSSKEALYKFFEILRSASINKGVIIQIKTSRSQFEL